MSLDAPAAPTSDDSEPVSIGEFVKTHHEKAWSDASDRHPRALVCGIAAKLAKAHNAINGLEALIRLTRAVSVATDINTHRGVEPAAPLAGNWLDDLHLAEIALAESIHANLVEVQEFYAQGPTKC